MAVNATVRDIVNFPGGTPKTITVDIIQIVPVAGNPLEGDEIWVSSATTAATASGGGAIQSIFKNEMKRGFVRALRAPVETISIGATTGLKIAIDEAIGAGVDITLTVNATITPSDLATDLESKIKAQAELGGGGSKIGNLSYLNVQVRFINNRFQIESGTVSSAFTGVGRSSVALAAPATDTDVRSDLGLDSVDSSETLATRGISDTTVGTAYTSGDILDVSSATGFSAGSAIIIKEGSASQIVVISGIDGAGLTASQMRFVTQSGVSTGLAQSFTTSAVVRELQEVDVADPVSAITTVDQLNRFAIDSMVNQIDFSA